MNPKVLAHNNYPSLTGIAVGKDADGGSKDSVTPHLRPIR